VTRPLLFSLLFLTLAATVYAAVRLPRTGQYTSYAAGDDGAVQAGAAWPQPRFADQGDGTVLDLLTGLVWSRDADPMVRRDPDFDDQGVAGDGAVDWARALAYVDKLNAEAFLGYTDWRLPNRRELMSLVDYGRSGPALPLYHPFEQIAAGPYWSATSLYENPSRAWTLDPDDGMVWYAAKGSATGHVWPVR